MMSLFDAQQNQEMFANSEREAGRLQERMNTIRRLLQKMSKKEVMEFGYTVEEIDMAEMSAV